MFLLLPDTPAIYPAWEALVIQHKVSGKPAHDARLVAAMQVHGLSTVKLGPAAMAPIPS
jgi:hypothetical protein